MRVEVVFAKPSRAFAVTLELESGTVAEAVTLALDTEALSTVSRDDFVALAVFGEVVDGERALEDGDRVELLRPLTRDPKTARRDRVRQLVDSSPSAPSV